MSRLNGKLILALALLGMSGHAVANLGVATKVNLKEVMNCGSDLTSGYAIEGRDFGKLKYFVRYKSLVREISDPLIFAEKYSENSYGVVLSQGLRFEFDLGSIAIADNGLEVSTVIGLVYGASKEAEISTDCYISTASELFRPVFDLYGARLSSKSATGSLSEAFIDAVAQSYSNLSSEDGEQTVQLVPEATKLSIASVRSNEIVFELEGIVEYFDRLDSFTTATTCRGVFKQSQDDPQKTDVWFLESISCEEAEKLYPDY